MARLNIKPKPIHTNGGARACRITPELQLRRAVMACMLFEKEFYEDGTTIAERIRQLVPIVHANVVAAIAVEARSEQKLRHVPLLIVREMARHDSHKGYVRSVLAQIIQRPDELCELLAHYWADGRTPIAKQIKLGLADAFKRFSEYQLQKWDKKTSIKLRDVMRMVHPKPETQDQADLWKRLLDGNMKTADTWETNLSSTTDTRSKAERWTKLLEKTVAGEKGHLGGMAMLRNIRNCDQAGVDPKLIRAGIKAANYRVILPFRFIAAAKAAPKYEDAIDEAFLFTCTHIPKLPGKTVVIIDVSGSMYGGPMSEKSDMNRALAACALGAITRELCEEPVIYATAGNDFRRVHKTALVPPRRGMSLVDGIHDMCQPLGGGGIFLKQVMDYVTKEENNQADRVICITDEQDCDFDANSTPSKAKLFPGAKHYMINVASNKNGIGYGKWLHIDGWSESVIKYIQGFEMTESL